MNVWRGREGTQRRRRRRRSRLWRVRRVKGASDGQDGGDGRNLRTSAAPAPLELASGALMEAQRPVPGSLVCTPLSPTA